MPRDIDCKIGEAKIQEINTPRSATQSSLSMSLFHQQILAECEQRHTSRE
jgi:hypothetical protein